MKTSVRRAADEAGIDDRSVLGQVTSDGRPTPCLSRDPVAAQQPTILDPNRPAQGGYAPW
jgi:hypothetical protein